MQHEIRLTKEALGRELKSLSAFYTIIWGTTERIKEQEEQNALREILRRGDDMQDIEIYKAAYNSIIHDVCDIIREADDEDSLLRIDIYNATSKRIKNLAELVDRIERIKEKEKEK